MNLYNNKLTIILIIFNIFFMSCANYIQGRISIKGNAPHTYLSITTPEGKEFRIVGELEQEISKKYQGNIIKLKGKIIHEGLGPGFPPHLKVNEIVK
jgi:hypothetical protein